MPRTRRPWWAALAALPFLVLVVAHWHLLPFREAGDYAQYMLHAKALAEGRSYSDIGYLYTPYNVMIGPRSQPPGWPLLLAPGVKLFGLVLWFPKVLVCAFAVAFLVIVARRLSKGDDRWLGVAAAAAVGAALETSYATNSALSDLPFAAMLWTVVLLADHDKPLTWPRVAVIGALGSFAMTVRVVGVVIIPMLLLLALVRRRDRVRLLTLVGAWVLCGLAVVLSVGVDRVPFLRLAIRGPDVMLGRFLTLWSKYRFGVIESLMYPVPWDVVNDAYHLLALLLIPIGLLDFARRFGRSALGCLVLTYALLVAAAPVADLRYLWPLWPVIVYCALAGARRVVSWIPRLGASVADRTVQVGVVVAIAGTVLTSSVANGRESLLSRDDAQQVFRWTAAAAARDSVRIVFVSPRVLTLATGVPAMGFFRATAGQTAAEFTRNRITHVVVGSAGIMHPPIDGMRALMRESPASFERVVTYGEFVIYRVKPPFQLASGE